MCHCELHTEANFPMDLASPSTGTTIVAVSYNNGIIIGSDSRVSMGTYISNRASDKLTPLCDNVWMSRSGSAADAQAISDYVRHWADQSISELGRQPTVRAVANLVKQITYNNKQLVGALLVAGWDTISGGQVYCLPIGGTIVSEKWGADGSGSPFILGFLDSSYREDLGQDEAEALVVEALSLAMTRDGSSGGIVRLVTTDSSGSKQKQLAGDKEDDIGDNEAEPPVQENGDTDMEAVNGDAEDEGGYEDNMENQIVLHEDKRYYPSAEEIYGQQTETLVMEEDAQPLEVPIIAPVKQKKFQIENKSVPTNYSDEFLVGLLNSPSLTRNIAVAGHLHHGKTVVMDMFVEQTHLIQNDARLADKPMRFTDTRTDEQERGISLKMTPMSFILEASSSKSYLINMIDTPGHVNFQDEVSAAFRAVDGVLLCVDAVEGCMLVTERVIRQALTEGLPIILLITKVDRLITELKLPPDDAYMKLLLTVKEVNNLINTYSGGNEALEVHPLKGNVAFASAQAGWSFTLQSFARLYADVYGTYIDIEKFSQRLWGDIFYYPETRKFSKERSQEMEGSNERLQGQRTFVHFILTPLYKIYTQVIGEHESSLKQALASFGVYLKPSSFGQDVKPLLKESCKGVFGSAAGLVDQFVRYFPSSRDGAAQKVEYNYTGPQQTDLATHIKDCNPRGPLVVHVSKLLPKPDSSGFDAYARVFSGSVKPGDRVRVLGEAYDPDDEEDSVTATVSRIWIFQAQYRVPISSAAAGNIVLLEGVDATITKTATIVSEFLDEACYIFRPLHFQTQAVMKIACEPLNPSELPKMVEGLRKINKSYPLALTKVEESGEHAILGTGEIYLDSLMKDLREQYADIEVKVADPVVSFCETVVETSSLKCFAETPNKKNKITMIAEPLERGLAEDIESGQVSIDWPLRRRGEFFQTKYDWDVLAARSIWAFGPDKQGPNILLDDSLPSEVDKQMLNSIKEAVVQGFQWGTREGPLCDEPIRNVKFKILDAQLASEPLHRSGGQIIPTARRVCYSSFLMATPRLMEPVYYVEIQTPGDCLTAIYTVLGKRRGHVTSDQAKPGTPIYIVKAYLPVIESFGFEVDLRYHTQGQAFCLSTFDHWQIVPGDPLDKLVELRPLQPAAPQELAREFMVKTRRRKGMSEDVSIHRFFDEVLLLELQSMGL